MHSAFKPTGAIGGAAILAALSCAIGVIDLSLRPLTLNLSAPSVPVEPVPQPTPSPARPAPRPAAPTNTPPVEPTAPADQLTRPSPAGHPRGEGFVTLEQARSLHQSGTASFIDARNPDEYASGSIPGAINMPPDAFLGGKIPDALFAISRDLPIVVYCGGGDCDASILVALKIRELGWKTAVVFEQGITGWKAAGLPVTGGGAP
ncbi:MAG: rhodanese-like domain-containing protein [Phycisphaeraceae bacterium]|nr:rhodanese-like domain-containing protein [Phycisphaeraceae bacterium]